MVVGAELLAGAERDVGEDQVDAEGGQLREQGVDFVLVGDDACTAGSMARAGSSSAAEMYLGMASEMPTVSLPGGSPGRA